MITIMQDWTGLPDHSFNEVVVIDPPFLLATCFFHIKDSYSKYSVALIVSDTSMSLALKAFEKFWVAQFQALKSIKGEQAFFATNFKVI